jgi:hypothetical protein
MSEFKGTKGKWEARLKGQIASAVYCDNTQICMRARSTTEAKADMLLISKAPEMLEMLQYFVDNNMLSVVGEEMAVKLIKQATEL